MCLAIPGKLIEIASDSNGVQTGDYVLVHVGFALSKVNQQEAARTYKLLEEMKQLGELDTPEVDPWSTAEAGNSS